MNIFRKIVKETLLIPVQIVRGTIDAIEDVVDYKSTKEK